MKKDHLVKEFSRTYLIANNLERTLNELEFQKTKLIDFTHLNDYTKKISDVESRIQSEQTENGLLKIQINKIRTKQKKIDLESNSKFNELNQLEDLENQKQEKGDQQQEQEQEQEQEQQQQEQEQQEQEQQEQEQQKQNKEEEEEKEKIFKKIQKNQNQIKIFKNKITNFQKTLGDLIKTKLQEEEITNQYFKTQQGKQLILDQNQSIEDLKQVVTTIDKRIKKITFELQNRKNSAATFFRERTRQNLIQIKIEKLILENKKIKDEISDVLDGFDYKEYFQVSSEFENKDLLIKNSLNNSNNKKKQEKEKKKNKIEQTNQTKNKITNLKKKI